MKLNLGNKRATGGIHIAFKISEERNDEMLDKLGRMSKRISEVGEEVWAVDILEEVAEIAENVEEAIYLTYIHTMWLTDHATPKQATDEEVEAENNSY